MKSRRPTLGFFRMGLSDSGVRSRFLGIYRSQFRGLVEAGADVIFAEDGPPLETNRFSNAVLVPNRLNRAFVNAHQDIIHKYVDI